MRPLWEGLLARFREDGGEVRLGHRVARLAVEDGRVVAAVTEQGEEIRGELFFSSAGGRETEMLAGAVGGTPAGSISIAEGIVLLDMPAAACGLTNTTVFYSFAEELAFRRPEGLVEMSNGVLCAPGNYAGIDENILKVTQLASYPVWRELSGEEYVAAKVRTGEGMAAALGKLGVRLPEGKSGRFGAFADVFTPLTLARYTHHAEGALYGSPVKSRSGATGYGNVFLIGADQGFHGIVGAMLSGVAMANMHCLAKRTANR
jgi:phytoene dehydrogenase-like protein